jgi:Protein of unknown function (DUF3006)
MALATVDRIENDTAVLILDGGKPRTFMIPAVLLPEGCREGDIITLTLEREPAGTQRERKRIAQQIERLKKG